MAMDADKVLIRKTDTVSDLGEKVKILESWREKKSKYKKYKTFIRGPMPLEWIKRACSLDNGNAAKTAWALWYLRGVTKSNILKFGNKQALEFGLSRHSKNQSLKAMEIASLVKLTQLPGQLHTVEILISDTEQKS